MKGHALGLLEFSTVFRFGVWGFGGCLFVFHGILQIGWHGQHHPCSTFESWLISVDCFSLYLLVSLAIEVKKRKKVLSWPSLMRKLSPSSDFSGSLEPELKVSLFDQPLSIICGENDTLPRPIQVGVN